jgi:hypothetical protein
MGLGFLFGAGIVGDDPLASPTDNRETRYGRPANPVSLYARCNRTRVSRCRVPYHTVAGRLGWRTPRPCTRRSREGSLVLGDRAVLEHEGVMVVHGGGGMFESEPRFIVLGLADVLAERGHIPFEAALRGDTISPQALVPVADAIFSTVSIPVSRSPIKGVTLSDLLALAGGIDFQTVHLSHIGGREVVLALLTAAGCKIVFAAADGISVALRHGLSYYLLRWTGVPEHFAMEHARKEVRRSRQKPKSRGEGGTLTSSSA